MTEDWLDRWANGRTGWHESEGNAGLMEHWLWTTGRVLVPLCGKSPDLAWLARRGHDVVGVELSAIAARHFFAEQGLEFDTVDEGPLTRFSAIQLPITVYCGDYFSFKSAPFDALYDRGALVAVDPALRQEYVKHTQGLLKPNAAQLIVTLEYDQEVAQGPPFAVTAVDMSVHWNELERVAEKNDIENCPPKFRDAGLTDIKEVVWRSVR